MLEIADKTFSSRLFTGTGKFSNSQLMTDAIIASGSELVTMALKRVDLNEQQDNILGPLLDRQLEQNLNLLPNTSGPALRMKPFTQPSWPEKPSAPISSKSKFIRTPNTFCQTPLKP